MNILAAISSNNPTAIFGVIAVMILFFGVVFFVNHYLAKKRREAVGAVAQQLGLAFSPDKDHALGKQIQFLDVFRGTNRYAFNRIHGDYHGFKIECFDFHTETHTTDSKGNRQTHHHYYSIFICRLPCTFVELKIHREGVLEKLGQMVGFEDIDFESAEFSRKFFVKSKDKKLAYDVVNAQMMQYLLSNDDISIELERDVLCVFFKRRLKPEDLAPNLGRLIEVRKRVPDYLFSNAQ
ncbi:MAG: hypothetical protein ACQKBV_09790 [Puniceicoccales bacterium]